MKEKASVLKRTVRGGAGFMLANVGSKGLNFLFVLIAGSTLGPARFGILALGLSVAGVARELAAFGLPTVIQRFLSGEGEEDASSIYGTILFVGGGAACISALLLYLGAEQIAKEVFSEPDLATPLQVLSLGVALAVPVQLGRAALQAQEKVGKIVSLDFFTYGAKVAALLLVFLFVQSATSAAVAVVLAWVLALAFVLYQVPSLDLRPAFSAIRRHVRRVVGYSGPLVLAGLGYFLAKRADQLMLGALAESADVGLYTVASSLALVLTMLHGSLVSIFKPIASEAYRKGNDQDLKEVYLFVGQWVGCVSGVMVLILTGFGTWILALFGAEYATSGTYHVLVILAGMYFLGTWIGPTGSLLQMSDRHHAEMWNTLVFVIVNVGLNFLLIPRLGILGAAWATFLSALSRNLLQVIEITRWHGFVPFSRRAVGILLFVAVGLGATLLLQESNLLRVGGALVSAAAVSGYALYSLTPEERRLAVQVKTRFASSIRNN